MVILPILAVVLLYINIYLIERERFKSIVYSIIINTCMVLILNEILSLGKILTQKTLVISWVLILSVYVLIGIYISKIYDIALQDFKESLRNKLLLCNTYNLFLVFISLISILLALITIPYNWDSMTYHLTRVVHWIQNCSVAHYACHDISQISDPTLGEFVILQVYLLSGNSDIFVNLLQSFSYILGIYLIFKISLKIGCSHNTSLVACIVFATTPIIFAESLSTQVDLFSALWLLIFVYLLLPYTIRIHKLTWNKETFLNCLFMGISMGLGYLAKPSVCIAMIVFIFWLILVCIRKKDQLGIVIKCSLTAIISGSAIIAAELLRNVYTFHGIAAKESSTAFIVPSWDIRYLFINFVRNFVFNLQTDLETINAFLEKIPFKLISMLYGGYDGEYASKLARYTTGGITYNHDCAPNTIVTWLLLFVILIMLIRFIYKKMKKQKCFVNEYAIVSIISLITFFTVVNWYRFVTRYEIGYFAIVIPTIMLILQQELYSKKLKGYLVQNIIFFLCMISFAYQFKYHSNFVDISQNRYSGYYKVRGIEAQYSNICDQVIEKQYKNIGFIGGADTYEYPIWIRLMNYVDRIEHVNVENETNIYEDIHYQPDSIIVCDTDTNEKFMYHDNMYQKVTDNDCIKLYVLVK